MYSSAIFNFPHSLHPLQYNLRSNQLGGLTTANQLSTAVNHPPQQQQQQQQQQPPPPALLCDNNPTNTNTNTNNNNNNSNSEHDGDYKIKQNEILQSGSSLYEVQEFIGRGTFGQVVKCQKKDTGDYVAIKILKNHPNYARQGQVEIQILHHLSNESSDSHNFVKTIEFFKHQGHTCLVFELLERNLFDYLKQHKFTPMPLNHIRPILQQVLTALIKLSELGIIHADIKPENIMLVNPLLEPFRVKLIDFGSATYSNRALDNTYLQSRYYRAPEIIIGVPFTEKIDVWSLGCVIAELFLGWPLYPGACEYDQIRFIASTEGLPPKHMLEYGKKSRQFFYPPDNLYLGTWRIKSEDEYSLETGTRPKDTRKYPLKRLQELINYIPNDGLTDQDKIIEELDRQQFIKLLVQMLSLDPASRSTPKFCKAHEFVTMNHLREFVRCKRVIQGIEIMRRACRRDTSYNNIIVNNASLHLPQASPTASQSIQYLLQQHQVLTQLQREQQLLNRQQELTWNLQSTQSQNTLPYFLSENALHTDRRAAQGIYPTPDWSPATEWCEYGSKSRPIVITDSPLSQCLNSDQLIKDHYKAQILRNLTAFQQQQQQQQQQTQQQQQVLPSATNPPPTLDILTPYLNPNSNLPASSTLSSLTNALATRFI